ncbi:hypothetical protein CF006_15560 [Escherichia coli]|nr:hypothetical protein CF006_15560 [Escherichia coli]
MDNDAHRRFSVCGDCFPLYLPGTRGDAGAGESDAAWLTHGFEVAGGILPAVGFGLLLRVMFKAQYIPYLIAGFLFVCYIQVSNLLPVAVLGAGFAVYEFFNAKSRQQAQPQPVASKNEEEDYSNGI